MADDPNKDQEQITDENMVGKAGREQEEFDDVDEFDDEDEQDQDENEDVDDV